MLENLYITKSKIRQDLLALFFTNPSRRYYLRELERILGYSAGNIRRELLKFQKGNLFNTQKIGNLKYYSINPEYPIYNELKSIVFKTIGVTGSLRNELLSVKNVKFAFIYGSFANKNENDISDIDLMIIGDPDISILNKKISDLERKIGREINHTIYSYNEYITKKSGGSGFILDLLKRPKIMLIGKEDDL